MGILQKIYYFIKVWGVVAVVPEKYNTIRFASYTKKVAANTSNIPAQQGIALISVLVTMSVIATVSASLTYTQYVDIERTEKLLQYDYGWSSVLSLENLAKSALMLDKKLNQYDGIQDKWLEFNNIPVGIDNSVISINLQDLQGSFNINNLFSTGNFFKVSRLQWVALLQKFISDLIDISADNNDQTIDYRQFDINIARDSVIDWIDIDNQELSSGAEALFYVSNGLGEYQVANAPLLYPYELAMIRGFADAVGTNVLEKLTTLTDTGKTHQQLEHDAQTISSTSNTPTLVALPISTKLNINFAKLDVLQSLLYSAAVLQSALDKQGKDDTQDVQTIHHLDINSGYIYNDQLEYIGLANLVIQDREGNPNQAFQDLSAFYSSLERHDFQVERREGFWQDALSEFVGIATNFFMLDSKTTLGDSVFLGRSLLYRTKAEVKVIYRSLLLE